MVPPRLTRLLLVCAASSLLARAVPAGPDTSPLINDLVRVPVLGSQHPRLARLAPTGAVPADLPMDRMLLALKLAPEARARLDQLLRDQQDPTSPRYHQWLTPDAFGQQFGPSRAQLDAAAGWLDQQGFTVDGVARGGLAITFSGNAAQVGKAFRTAMVEYDVDGVKHHGNATPISLPAGLAAFAGGVVSLDDMRRTSLVHPGSRRPQLLDGHGHNDVGAGDFAVIYGLAPLFAAGTTGAGVTIGVVGRCDVESMDHGAFVTAFSLGGYGGTFTVIHNGADPGITSSDEEFEADVDTQWTTAAAPGAAVDLVVSPSSYTTDGVDLSSLYIVDNQLAPLNQLAQVMTVSFGACEGDMGAAGNLFYQQLWAQAASEGISVFVAAGDSGPAGCDDPGAFAGTVRAVSGLASTPYDTAVGGTMFDEGSGSYWLTSITSEYQTTAKGYIPEAAWNESGDAAGGGGLWAGGGGTSSLYPKPAWQSALSSVPAGSFRDLPDVSFTSAVNHDSLVAFQGGVAYLGGGTSFASPSMAGIMALVVQKHGSQGNANFTLYSLAKAQYQNSGSAVFHDVAAGTTNVPGVQGFAAGPGYDLATGLGSLDAAVLVNDWVAGANPITVSITSPTQGTTVVSGHSLSFTGTATDTGTGTLAYTWDWGDGTYPTVPTGAAATHIYAITGTVNKTFHPTLTVSDGTYVEARSVNITVTPGVSAYLNAPVTNVGVLPGVQVTFTAGTATTSISGASITGYTLDFGDGTTPLQATAPPSGVTHAFLANSAAPYTVTLTAADSTGATGQAMVMVYADTSVLDVNGDGAADVRDLLVLSGAWNPGVQATPSQFNGLNFACDLNGDGRVDDTDLNLWIQNFSPGGAP